MSNRSGSAYSVPRDANRVPFLVAASTADGITPVVLEADPTTHQLQVSSSGGGGGTQYAEGATTSPATGNVALGRYSSSTPSLSSNQLESLQLDSSGNLKVKLPNDTTATGTISGSGQSVTIATNGQTSVGIQVSGTFSGTILIKGSVDGTSYTPTSAVALSNGAISSTITSSYTGQANAGGLVSFQLTAITWASGSASVTLVASVANSTVMLDNPLPIGTNSIGNVGLNAGSNAIGSITNTSFTATQATGSNLHTVVDSGTINATISGSISNTSFAATQATASALNATVVGTGTFATQVTSLPSIPAGSNAIGSITNTSFTATQATGTNLHTVTDSGSVTNATLSAETTKVIGTVRTADGSGNLLTSTTNALDVNIKSGSIANTSFTVTQATGTNLHTVVDSGTVTANISGSISNTSFAATQATASALNMTEANSSTIATNTTGLNNTVGTTGSAAPSKGLLIQGSDGTNARNILTNSVGVVYTRATIDQTTPGNTNAVYVSNTSVPVSQATASSLNATVVPGTATGSAVPSVSYPTGFQARSSDITATTSTYNTIGITDLVGKQIVQPYAINQLFVKGSNSATTTSSTSLITAAGAGVSNYITSISVMNTGATTTVVNIQDGSTTMYQVGAPAGGGAVVTLPVPIKGTANTAVNFATLNASTTVYVSVAGYTGA